MTKSEFVKISVPEQGYGQGNLLNSQLEMLNLIKSFREYKGLRNEELVLKVTLKNKVEEALNLINKLEKQLPKAHYKAPMEGGGKERKKSERKLSLQGEIERVRAKLARIQGEK